MDHPRPRSPGVVYAAASTALIVLLGLVALTSRQAPPPSIAEFAPRALSQITDASTDSSFGASAGAAPRPTASTPSTGEGTPGIDVPRVRRCVGDPPRQIEDPQSPPCVSYWSGNNGGATYKGITHNEIRVIDWPNDGGDLSRGWTALAAFFNQRFEFYGRRIVLVPSFEGGKSTTAGLQADAVRADEQMKVFASLPYPFTWADESTYYDELARRGIVSVLGRTQEVDSARMLSLRPYEWIYHPPSDVVQIHLGEWVCKTLAGRNADYAKGVEGSRKRVFGAAVHRSRTGEVMRIDRLRDGLARCGERITEEVQVLAGGNLYDDDYRNAVLKLRSAGVNSVISMAQAGPLAFIEENATTQSYYPEWIMSSWGEQDYDWAQLAPNQDTQKFGLRFYNKEVPFIDEPCQWAVKQVDPNFQWPERDSGIDTPYTTCRSLYPSFLLLASGIQMAGPYLTPQTFAQGLIKAPFPNPNCNGPPYWQACVGFSPRRLWMQDSGSVIYWNPSGESYTRQSGTNYGNPRGTFCNLDSARRYEIGNYPAGRQVLFDYGSPCH